MHVHVIIPAFNAALTLAEAIRSVIGQTHDDLSVTVVDDGSADASAVIAERFAGTRVRVLRRAHEGVSAARNAGLALGIGDAVLFLDADDWLAGDAVERLAAALSADPGAVAAAGPVVRFTAAADYTRPRRPRLRGLMPGLLLCNRFVNGGQLLIRSCALAGGLRTDLAFGEDWEMWVRVAMRGDFVRIGGRAPVLYARDRADGAMRRMAGDPARHDACIDAIFAFPPLVARYGWPALQRYRLRAKAEAAWTIGRARLRDGDPAEAWPWLWESVVEHPVPRRLVLLAMLWARAAWRGPPRLPAGPMPRPG